MALSSAKGKGRALEVDSSTSPTAQAPSASSSAGPQAPNRNSSSVKRPKGKGKQRKTFSEDLGLAHLKALSASIADEKEQGASDRLQKAKQRREQADKRKKVTSAAEGSGSLGKGNRIVKTLDLVKAQLKAKVREKTKKRKEARRPKTDSSPPAVAAEGPSAPLKKRKKAVSFG